MPRINVVTHETANADQKALLDAIESQLGIVPNFLKVFANSPDALKAFLGLHGIANAGALDALTRRFLQRELLRIWQEQQRTVVFITHSVTEAIYLADRILVMSSRPGQIRKEWRLASPRPRDLNSDELRQLETEIYSLLDEEVTKTFSWAG